MLYLAIRSRAGQAPPLASRWALGAGRDSDPGGLRVIDGDRHVVDGKHE